MRKRTRGNLRQGLLVTCLFHDTGSENLQSEGRSNIRLPIRMVMEIIGVLASYSRNLDRKLRSL